MPFLGLAALPGLIGGGLGAAGSSIAGGLGGIGSMLGVGGTAGKLLGGGLLGGNILSGILGNREKTQKWTQDQTQTQKGTVKTARTLLPQQQAQLEPLFGVASKMLSQPGAMLDPIKAGMRTSVNKQFGDVEGALAAKLGRAGGQSGKLGRSVRQAELGRLGQLGDVDTRMAEMLLSERDKGVSLSERLLGMNFGQEVSTDMTQTTKGSGTGTTPGNMAAGGLSGGLDFISTLLGMNRMLQGGGGGGVFKENPKTSGTGDWGMGYE